MPHILVMSFDISKIHLEVVVCSLAEIVELDPAGLGRVDRQLDPVGGAAVLLLVPVARRHLHGNSSVFCHWACYC